jgi:hypothetical protein
MELECSIPHSQMLATYPYSEQQGSIQVRGLFEYFVT